MTQDLTIKRRIDKLNVNLADREKHPWKISHREAWVNMYQGPRNETSIRDLLQSLANYADNHRAQFDRDLADDGFLGPVWLEMCRNFLQLLNGDLGRLDAGTLDKSVREMCRMAGFSDEEADTL